jgi:sarcosine oxidase subunit gamma
MAEVTVSAPLGMIGLRGDLSEERLRAAVQDVTGVGVPDRLRIEGTSERGAAWMSPDELLLFVPRDEVGAAVARLSEALAGTHHLVTDVSDLRVCLRLDGPEAREVLAKLTPADLHPEAFGPGVVRRSRLGQVAAAFWLEGEGARVICFRSVGDYMLALLRQSALDGAVGFF